MKKVLFIFAILFLLIINTKAQTYHPLIKSNKFWDIQHVMGYNICVYSGGNRYFFQGDTTILGEQYKIIRCNSIVNVNPGPYCPPYAIDTSISWISQFCMREDTSTRKVYIYTINHEHDLLFDFSLNVGDTLKSQYAGMGLTLIVDSVRTISLSNGSQRKIFYLNNNEFYIEGVGGSQGLCFPMAQAIGGWEDVKCVKENGINLWGNYCFFGYVGINENTTANNLFIISPNPFSQSTQITLNHTYHNITLAVYDIQGKQVAQQQYADSDKIQFSRNQLSNGLYFLKLTLDDKMVETGKIVISE